MTYVLTLISTLVVVLLVLLVFYKLGLPVYRLERINVIRLLELVIAKQATDDDWDIFIGLVIRHDPALDAIRQQCADIAEREMLGERRIVEFSARGYLELQEILHELQRLENAQQP